MSVMELTSLTGEEVNVAEAIDDVEACRVELLIIRLFGEGDFIGLSSSSSLDLVPLPVPPLVPLPFPLIIRLFGEGDLIGLSSSVILILVLVSNSAMGCSGSSLMVSRAEEGFFEGRPRFLGNRT